MLTFEEKLSIINSFPELVRKDISMGRVNFHYEKSALDKKIVVHNLHPNGNGFVYTRNIGDFETDHKGMTNIRDYSESALRDIIKQAIKSLSPSENAEVIPDDERWINTNEQTLLLTYEDGLWNVYAGQNLDGSFHSYKQATQFLDEEGFQRG
ncbi:hypothetical protein CFK37_10795 [Virgibacillus phasianinus]|uniref:Uncharacterized protein n=1 Tax=Virgibacillus phasianinus TaxID=2017483 RepID=A0A220U3I1_9BACI|nr:hypothetical protein [Virgibacillus phasianinus]ASK62605.1 hypothetical protein CFK37_10795 [Virgibacillus phasianinus]